MYKRFSILIIIIILIILICNYSIRTGYKYLSWKYNIPKGELATFLSSEDPFLILTTKRNSIRKSYIHLIDKKSKKDSALFEFIKILEAPEFKNNFLFVVSKDKNYSDFNDLYVINTKNNNLVWKDRIYNNKWSYIIKENSIFYVDSSGILRNIDYKNRTPIWKILSSDGFYNSTPPEIQNNKIYICNDTQILIADASTSKILHNFKTDYNTKSCVFDSDIATILMENDDIYAIDLLRSQVMWEYKHVSLFSKTTLDIAYHKYITLLNTINFTMIDKSSRAKVLNNIEQNLHVISLLNGETRWQKEIKYPTNIAQLKNFIASKNIVLQTVKGTLTAFNIENGIIAWNFYLKEGTIPHFNYIIKNDTVVLTMKKRNQSLLYLINATSGKIINYFIIPNIKNNAISPVIDEAFIYLIDKNNDIVAFDLAKTLKNKKIKD